MTKMQLNAATKSIFVSAATLFVLSGAVLASVPSAQDAAGYVSSPVLSGDMEAKRSKPRVPGGSGCDTAQDRAEHPECSASLSIDTLPVLTPATGDQEAKRSKPRVPGGSGCDSPRDRIEHPECRSA